MQRTARSAVLNDWREDAKGLTILGVHQRVLQRDVHDGHLSVIVGHEPKGWHLSISHRTNVMRPRPGRYPTWDEIADARYRFVPDAVTMAFLLPPRGEYVNVHPTTFHLHQVQGDFDG
jgi:hypothetical protein